MAEFNIRSDSVDVEQIMNQIRARIREKRGVDYTEEQIRELASVRLEKFLDPKNLRSDLLEQFRKTRPALPEIPKEPPPVEAPYTFDDQTLFASHRGVLVFIRKLLKPILKLLFNPNTLNQILHTQAQFNVDMLKRDARRKIEFQIFDRSRAEWNVLYYEVLHNLVLESTRTGIEVKNLKMRVESLASRLEFSERRVRALEGVVQYRPEVVRRAERVESRDRGADADEQDSATAETAGATGQTGAGEGARRRRRRRRGRRGAGAAQLGAPGTDTTARDEAAAANAEGISSEPGASGDDESVDLGDTSIESDDQPVADDGESSPDADRAPDDEQ